MYPGIFDFTVYVLVRIMASEMTGQYTSSWSNFRVIDTHGAQCECVEKRMLDIRSWTHRISSVAKTALVCFGVSAWW